MEILKSHYERQDVSGFRQYVRRSRFKGIPYWIDALLQIEERLENQDEEPVVVISTSGWEKNREIDILGTGKTDLIYYITNVFREKGITVLAFPDLKDILSHCHDFYHDILIKEIFLITIDTFWDYCKKILDYLTEILVSIFFRLLIILRVGILSILTLLGFILGVGFVAFTFLFEKHFETIGKVIAEFRLDIVLVILAVVGVIYIWSKIRADKTATEEWNNHAPKARYQDKKDQSFNRINPELVLKRLRPYNKILIIIDDADLLDSKSFNNLMTLIEVSKKFSLKLGIILIYGPSSEQLQNGHNDTNEYSLDLEIRRHGRLHFVLTPPSIEEVRCLFWGQYQSIKCDEIIDSILDHLPEVPCTPSILIQFLYEVADVLEKGSKRSEDYTLNQYFEWYKEFLRKHAKSAEDIIQPLEGDILYPAIREFLLYLLAYEDEKAEKSIIDQLMRNSGHEKVSEVSNILIKNDIIFVDRNDRNYCYCFTTSIIKRKLYFWNEWRENSTNYITNLFEFLAKQQPNRIKKHPHLALKCNPTKLTVDVLWRESEAIWLFGGNGDTHLALQYAGLDDGALAKWLSLYYEANSADDIDGSIFFWISEAPNSPYRYLRTSKSKYQRPSNTQLPFSYIGDLFCLVGSLYIQASDHVCVRSIFETIWPGIRKCALVSTTVDEGIKKLIRETDEEMLFLYAKYLLDSCSSSQDWNRSKEILEHLNANAQNSIIQKNAQVQLSRLLYLSRFATGNSLVNLIKTPNIPSSICAEGCADLDILELKVSHALTYLEYGMNISSEKDRVNEQFNMILEYFHLWKKQIKRSIEGKKADYYSRGMEVEISMLISQAIYCLYIGNFLLEQSSWFRKQNPMQNKPEEIGLRIRKFYDYAEEIRSFHSIHGIWEPEDTKLVEEKWKVVAAIYGDYISTESTKSIRSYAYSIEKDVVAFSNEIAFVFFWDATKFLGLAGQLAYLCKMPILDNIIQYELVLVHQARYIVNDPKNNLNWQIEVLNQLEKKSTVTIGKSFESILAHILIAKISINLNISAIHYKKALNYLVPIKSNIPRSAYANLILFHLTAAGNYSAITSPDEILSLAQEAHEIYKDFLENEIDKNTLNYNKASIRWWISEAYCRLAQHHKSKAAEYYDFANNHLNWIDVHVRANEIDEIFLTKVCQVRSHFLQLIHNIDGAESQLTFAMQYFHSVENNQTDEMILERMQTLTQLLQILVQKIEIKLNGKQSIPKEFQERFFATLFELKSLVFIVENRAQKNVASAETFMVSLHSASYLPTVIRHYVRSADKAKEEMDLVRLWVYAVRGYQTVGMFGKSAIVASSLKLSDLPLPADFTILIERAVTNWDPRYEDTDQDAVMQSFYFLMENKQDALISPKQEQSEITDVIIQSRKILARENADLESVITILKGKMPDLSKDDPKPEFIELLILLQQCYIKDSNFFEAERIASIKENLLDNLRSKIYYELAITFEQNLEIAEKFLCMAVSGKSQNKYKEQAAEQLARNYGNQDKARGEVIRTRGDEYTFQLYMEQQDFDQGSCYTLLVLFERELRRLICNAFGADGNWDMSRIPSDIIGKVKEKAGEKLTGYSFLEYVDLGDLFKIILLNKNWEDFFEPIFKSKSFLDSRIKIIIDGRNSIAHSRLLSDQDIKDFVTMIRSILVIIKPYSR